METRAAVAHEAGKPLTIETVQLDGPKAGEVLVEVKATGICHTDAFTLSGGDPEGRFPAILGPEGPGIAVGVGAGVTPLKKGDHVTPLYTPECRQCESCLSRKTNLCTAIRATQGQGVMPDGTTRFSLGGQKIHHYMGTSTFANFTVLPEIAVAKIREDAPFDKVCYIGCGVTTGIGAVINTAKVEPGANVVIFGLGGIGLNVIQGCRMVGADMIVGVDTNPKREVLARKFGLTHFVNPTEVQGDLVPDLVDLFPSRSLGSVTTKSSPDNSYALIRNTSTTSTRSTNRRGTKLFRWPWLSHARTRSPFPGGRRFRHRFIRYIGSVRCRAGSPSPHGLSLGFLNRLYRLRCCCCC